jgi:hypothetical protein
MPERTPPLSAVKTLEQAAAIIRSQQRQTARQGERIRVLTDQIERLAAYAASQHARADYWEMVARDLLADALETAARTERPRLYALPPWQEGA